MPWDARSRRVFLEIPDKSWCCYLAFDSFPCMEAQSSWFFLRSAPAQPISGEGLAPWPHNNRKAQLELCTSLPRSGTAQLASPPQSVLVTHGAAIAARTWRVPRARGAQELQDWERAWLSHTPAPHLGWREERPARPPHPHGQQPALIHLSPSLKRPALALGCTREYDYAHFIH